MKPCRRLQNVSACTGNAGARGEVLLRLAIDQHTLLSALIESGMLTDEEALNARTVEAAAAEVLREWSRRWLKK